MSIFIRPRSVRVKGNEVLADAIIVRTNGEVPSDIMRKSVYDTDDNGIVDYAENVEEPARDAIAEAIYNRIMEGEW